MSSTKTNKKDLEHNWTDFEKHTLQCLMARGMHHEIKDPNKTQYYNDDAAVRKNTYLDISTALNDSVNLGDYVQDIDKREVTKTVDRMMIEHRGVLGKGGYLERQKVARMTRGLRLVLSRTPPISYNGSLAEWLEGGRKLIEEARLELMYYRHRVQEWRREDWEKRRSEQPPWADVEMSRGSCRGHFFGAVDEVCEDTRSQQGEETAHEMAFTSSGDDNDDYRSSVQDITMQGLLDTGTKPIRSAVAAFQATEEDVVADHGAERFLADLSKTLNLPVDPNEYSSTQKGSDTLSGSQKVDQAPASSISTRKLKKPTPKVPHLKRPVFKDFQLNALGDTSDIQPTSFGDLAANLQLSHLQSSHSLNHSRKALEQSMTSFSDHADQFRSRPTLSRAHDSRLHLASSQYIVPSTDAEITSRVQSTQGHNDDGDISMDFE